MKLPTYDELIKRYPPLTLSEPHEALVLAAYLAGRIDLFNEQIEADVARAARSNCGADLHNKLFEKWPR